MSIKKAVAVKKAANKPAKKPANGAAKKPTPAADGPEHALRVRGLSDKTITQAQRAGLDLRSLLELLQRHGPAAIKILEDVLTLFGRGTRA